MATALPAAAFVRAYTAPLRGLRGSSAHATRGAERNPADSAAAAAPPARRVVLVRSTFSTAGLLTCASGLTGRRGRSAAPSGGTNATAPQGAFPRFPFPRFPFPSLAHYPPSVTRKCLRT